MKRTSRILQGGAALAAAAALVFSASNQASAAEHRWAVYNESDEAVLTVDYGSGPTAVNPQEGHKWTGTADSYTVTVSYPGQSSDFTTLNNDKDQCIHVLRSSTATQPTIQTYDDYNEGCGFLG